VADFYAARDSTMPPLPWPSIAPPITAYPSLSTQIDKDAEILLAVDGNGASKRAAEMSKGTRFQLYLALRAAAPEQLVAQGTTLPFFCDDIFKTFDEARTSAACRVMESIGGRGQAFYLTHTLTAIVNGHRQSQIDELLPWHYAQTV
jgi:uncharacterized protein YhaN